MISELTLSTPDLYKTLAFYTDTLGLPVTLVKQSVGFDIGRSRLIFKEDPGCSSIYHFAIEIPHNQLIEAYNWIHSKVEIIPAGNDAMFSNFVSWNAQSFYFKDLTGNLVELICRYDLPNISSKEFSSGSFLYISEIGIVTEDVQRMVRQLGDQYGIRPFSKQPPLQNFAALGEEEGLLIIVQQGRNWFPTEIPAQHAACNIKWNSGKRMADIYL